MIKTVEERLLLRQAYIRTKMSNKYVIAVPSEIIKYPSNDYGDTTINFTDFVDAFKYICDNRISSEEHYELLPYFRQAQDISIAMLLSSICPKQSENQEIAYKNKEYVDEIHRGLKEDTLKIDNKNGKSIIVIDNKINNKLRIAIANVNVGNVSNIDSVLKGRKPNRLYSK